VADEKNEELISLTPTERARLVAGNTFSRVPNAAAYTTDYDFKKPESTEGLTAQQKRDIATGAAQMVGEMAAEYLYPPAQFAFAARDLAQGFAEDSNLLKAAGTVGMLPLVGPVARRAIKGAKVAKHVARNVDNPAFKDFFGKSKVVDDEGAPLILFHGTPHDFDAFQPGGTESAFGSAIYFSSGADDVARNYSRIEGPDLENRIGKMKDMLADDFDVLLAPDEDVLAGAAKVYGNRGMDEAEIARLDPWDVVRKLDGDPDFEEAVLDAHATRLVAGPASFRTIPAYIKMEKPVYLDAKGNNPKTFLEFEYDPELDEYTGEGAKLLDSISDVLYDLDVYSPESDISHIHDLLFTQMADYGGIHADEVFDIIKGTRMIGIEGEFGETFGNAEVARQLFEKLGYDGIVANAYRHFGPTRFGRGMEGIEPDTYHYMAFAPEQVKGAISNTTFNPADPRYNYGIGAGAIGAGAVGAGAARRSAADDEEPEMM